MMIKTTLLTNEERITRSAYLWTKVLDTPFWAISSLMLFVLYGDLHASALQITIFVALKPASSLFAFYWSSWIKERSDRLIGNIIWATVLGHAPFLLAPFIDNAWFFVMASGFYMMLYRGVVPAWMEILKLNMTDAHQKTVFAYVNTVMYIGSGLLPIVFGWLLDGFSQSWRWIFPITAVLSAFSILFQLRIPIPIKTVITPSSTVGLPLSIRHLWQPWLDAWKLLQSRSDFARYQLSFIMIGGTALMIIQPALPEFFMGSLHLSFTEVATAIGLCKGIGYVATTPLWAKAMQRIDLFRFSSYVTLLALLYPLCLVAATMHISWVYIAYLLYGIMQGGSELSWHLSGPIFAKQEDSSPFSGVNVVSIGVRGCVMPFLGYLLFSTFGAIPVLLLCVCLLLMATIGLKSGSQESGTGSREPGAFGCYTETHSKVGF